MKASRYRGHLSDPGHDQVLPPAPHVRQSEGFHEFRLIVFAGRLAGFV